MPIPIQKQIDKLESELKTLMDNICQANNTASPEYKNACKTYKAKKDKLERLKMKKIIKS